MKPQREQILLDIECYPNWFCVVMKKMSDDKIAVHEIWEDKKRLDIYQLEKLFASNCDIVTFNGMKYDIPLLKYAMTEATTKELFEASETLIHSNNLYQFNKDYPQHKCDISHIDIIDLLPGKSGLKLYGARIHAPKLQDLPIKPGTMITDEQRKLLLKYCKNDVDLTGLLYEKVVGNVGLRRELSREHRTDLRSKSDPQLAEILISRRYAELSGRAPARPQAVDEQFYYKAPDYISFKTDLFKQALGVATNYPITVTSMGQFKVSPELMTFKLTCNKSTYQMGIGGLHSQDSKMNYQATRTATISDFDVGSYYPNIIVNNGFYPERLGKVFLTLYTDLLKERLAAKASGDKITDATLKLALNSGFGKFGSVYSNLYAPDLMVQVTLTGQLSLLMLIEQMELNDISVISANTDGIVLYYLWSDEEKVLNIIREWEKVTKYNMERTDYLGLYSRDVNNYVAVKQDNTVKTKGVFRMGDLSKNPANEICAIAAIKYITEGIDVEKTIRECTDVTKFLTVRTVKGGAIKGKVELGRNIRWYYGTRVYDAIYYVGSGNKVPKSDGAVPLLDLPKELPKNINYDKYISEAYELLADVGLNLRGQMSLW